MTLKRIADLAKTSVATVSKAFSGSKEISDETKERIFEIAKEYGCFEKYYNAPRKQPLIAIIVPEIDSECYATCASVFEREFNRRGADTIVATTRFDPNREERLFRELAYGMKVDGVLLWGSGSLIKNHDEIPLIKFGEKSYSDANADTVKSDSSAAINRLIKTIKDYGHTEVAFFGESLTHSKEEKFKKGMRSAGLSIHKSFILTSDKRFAAAGKDCMQRLMASGRLPSVIVAAYDQIAYGAMKYARDMGLRVPEDISFVGMDDITADSYFDVPLSSVHSAYESVCEKITDLIFMRMENKHYRMKEKIVVPVELNIRESLKNLKAESDR